MKVLLVANYLHDEQESMHRFAGLMARGLAEANHDVRIVRPVAFFGQLHPSPRGVGKWLGYIDKFATFPFALRRAVRWAEVVHICDQANAIYIKHIRPVPHVVTCHDLLAIRSALGEIPQHRTSWTGRRLQHLILTGLTGAQHIACVSDATRRDLLRVSGIPEHRVSRAYNTLNYPYSRMETGAAAFRLRNLSLDPTQPFLLHVGGNQWYKNRLGVLRVFSVLRKLTVNRGLKLVMAGKPWTAEMRRFVVEQGMSGVALELTTIADEDLRALYSTATILLFPSFEEGFGWPILEAQACGCPVITSSRSPMNEVGGNAAIYINPEDPESAARTVKQSLELLPGIREASILNASRFSGSAMIEAYVALYNKVRNDNVPAHQIN